MENSKLAHLKGSKNLLRKQIIQAKQSVVGKFKLVDLSINKRKLLQRSQKPNLIGKILAKTSSFNKYVALNMSSYDIFFTKISHLLI